MQAVGKAPSVLALAHDAPPTVEAFEALASFSVLGGHIWAVSPGARVGISQPGSDAQTAATVLRGGADSHEVLALKDSSAAEWRKAHTSHAVEHVAVRSPVAVPFSSFEAQLGPLLDGYR